MNNKDLYRKLYDIEIKRKSITPDLYLIVGQLDSITCENIDAFAFYHYLRSNKIPVKILVNKHHIKYDANDDGMIGLETNCVSTTELIDKHADLFIRCKCFIMEVAALHPIITNWLKKLSGCKFVFMDHGEFKYHWLPYYEHVLDRFNYINVSSLEEQNFITKHVSKKFFGKFSTNPFILAGLPRRDRLTIQNQITQIHSILLMPTWRIEFTDKNIIEKSKYFEQINFLLTDKKIQEWLKVNNIKIFYSIHHHLLNVIPEIKNLFSSEITICNNLEISKYVNDCDLCITDFSSIATDFEYQNKPVIFWRIDVNDLNLSSIDKLKVQSGYNETQACKFTANSIDDIVNIINQINNGNLILDNCYRQPKSICKKLFEQLES